MVLLSITPAIAQALKKVTSSVLSDESGAKPTSDDDAQVGKPISHNQIVELWQSLRKNGHEDVSLESLLRGSRVYVPPPPPKPEPTAEYKALMARLREEEEERKYKRMLNPPKTELSNQRFADFASVNRALNEDIDQDEAATYAEIQHQLMLIINFLISIAGVAATLWIVAKWWSTPARIALSMGGAIAVGIAEVAVYSAFVWRVDQSDRKSKRADKRIKEVRSVERTWVVDKDGVREGGIDQAENTVVQVVGDPTGATGVSVDSGELRRRTVAIQD